MDDTDVDLLRRSAPEPSASASKLTVLLAEELRDVDVPTPRPAMGRRRRNSVVAVAMGTLLVTTGAVSDEIHEELRTAAREAVPEIVFPEDVDLTSYDAVERFYSGSSVSCPEGSDDFRPVTRAEPWSS
ncbi:hypothetical protein [Oceanitalea stevensii]|uniref:Transposase family protein n=1 Tax=Oceanitalea stevensii TaxID=2763072 RepID=A0ABR8Z454_9MICO|nr:hypothetical protein [Oceanitalea stevensii]MBD8063128.1 hypothetical protein [Oceanitalea stevensii]